MLVDVAHVKLAWLLHLQEAGKVFCPFHGWEPIAVCVCVCMGNQSIPLILTLSLPRVFFLLRPRFPILAGIQGPVCFILIPLTQAGYSMIVFAFFRKRLVRHEVLLGNTSY